MLAYGGRNEADCGRIEAVGGDDKETEYQDHDLKAREWTRVCEFMESNGLRVATAFLICVLLIRLRMASRLNRSLMGVLQAA